jgi:hypothetical protein
MAERDWEVDDAEKYIGYIILEVRTSTASIALANERPGN